MLDLLLQPIALKQEAQTRCLLSSCASRGSCSIPWQHCYSGNAARANPRAIEPNWASCRRPMRRKFSNFWHYSQRWTVGGNHLEHWRRAEPAHLAAKNRQQRTNYCHHAAVERKTVRCLRSSQPKRINNFQPMWKQDTAMVKHSPTYNFAVSEIKVWIMSPSFFEIITTQQWRLRFAPR